MKNPSNVRHRPGALLFAALFVLLALFLVTQIPAQVIWVKNGKVLGQPALWPGVGVVGMLLFGVAHLATRLRAPRIEVELAEGLTWLRSIEFAIWFMVYVWAVPQIGYLLASLVFATLLALRAGYRDARTLWLAAGFALSVVVVFKALLSVRIPGGAIYDWLPSGALKTFLIVNF